MPNCTAYAFGRAYEILGTEPNLSHGNAQDWYGYNQATGAYSYGSTPQVGAIACWSYNGGGHVAVVESIDNGVVTLSNSALAKTAILHMIQFPIRVRQSTAGGISRDLFIF